MSWILIYHTPQSFWVQIKNKRIQRTERTWNYDFLIISRLQAKNCRNLLFERFIGFCIIYVLCILSIEGKFWYIISPGEDKNLRIFNYNFLITRNISVLIKKHRPGGAFENLAEFTGKRLCWSLFLIKFRPHATLLKKRLQHKCSSYEFY